MTSGAARREIPDAPIALHVRMGSRIVGGIDRALANLAIGLERVGQRLNLAVLDDRRTDWALLGSVLAPSRVEVHRVAGGFRFDPRFSTRLAALSREVGATVLHSWDYKSAVVAMLASARAGIPWVATRHGHAFESPSLRLYGIVERLALRHAAAVFAVSDSLAAELRTRPGVRLVPNAVPAPDSPPRGRVAFPRRMIAVGRFEPEKGFDLLLDALPSCLDSVRDLSLTVIGEGSQRRQLIECAARLGLGGSVSFEGWRTDITSALDRAELIVVPSRRDNQPLVLLEAMARGLPAVVTAVGEMERLVSSPATGIVVPPGSSAALAGGILIATRSVFDGEAAWSRVRRDHSPERLALVYIEEYRALSACRRRTPGGAGR